jgi:NADH:flavin oxidoreductase / NADH oxidase family
MMSHPILFTPMQIGNLKLANRIVIAPMAQYSAEDGQMSDWHLMHLGQLVSSGAAALTVEGTAVTPDGRTTYGDVGLYSDDCESAMGVCCVAFDDGRTCRSESSSAMLAEKLPGRSRGKMERRFHMASQMVGVLMARHRSFLLPVKYHPSH